MSGDAPTANETLATIRAANAPAPRPRLLLLGIDKKPQFPRPPLGVSANRHQCRAIVEEAQGGLGKVRLDLGASFQELDRFWHLADFSDAPTHVSF